LQEALGEELPAKGAGTVKSEPSRPSKSVAHTARGTAGQRFEVPD
jgi:hypothetical protein